METSITRYCYLPDTHPVFRVPPRSSPLWRYMTLPKLLAMLEASKLFFCRASMFPDRFEGAIPKALDTSLREWEGRVMGPGASDKSRAERMRTRNIVVANCWHMSTHESSAMWNLYGKNDESVAVRSTVGGLIDALPQRPTPRDQRGWEAIFLGEVGYIDYARATFPPDNVYWPFVHKREDYRHENKVRAITMNSEDAIRAAQAASETDFEISAGGLAVPIDIDTLTLLS